MNWEQGIPQKDGIYWVCNLNPVRQPAVVMVKKRLGKTVIEEFEAGHFQLDIINYKDAYFYGPLVAPPLPKG